MQPGMIKKKLNLTGILYLLMAAVVVWVMVFIVVIIRKNVYEDDSVLQDGEYSIKVGDKEYESADLSALTFDTAEAGTEITYSTILKGPEVNNPVITIYLVHSMVRIYIDDQEIYDYGESDWHMFGYGYVNATIPDDYIGRKLTVYQTVMERGEVSKIYTPRVYNAHNQLHNLIDENYFYIILDIALVALSLVIMLISACYMNLLPTLRSLITLAASFCAMGIWEMCRYNIIWIFSDSLMLRGYMEYISLYCAPFLFLLYFFNDFYEKEKTGLRKVYLFLLVAQGVFIPVSLLLHFTDIIHLPRMLMADHVLLFSGVVFIFYMLVRLMKKNEEEHKVLFMGLMILIGIGLFDLIRFNILRYVKKSSAVENTSYLLLGFFVFMITMVIDFFIGQRKGLFDEAENKALSRMAYVDMLTNLANRRRCEETFDDLVQSSEVYGIISFDMNGLKITNDNYGHPEGDRLLIDFSNLLQGVFGKYGLVGRMGGDEFIVILPGVDHLQFEMIEQELDEKKREINLDRKPLPINYAYGYCRSDDPEVKTKDGSRMEVNAVYRLADERMYRNKIAMKKRTVRE